MILTQVYLLLSIVVLIFTKSGQTDTFSGAVLGTCTATKFPADIFEFVVKHHGFDGWCMHSVELEFSNGDVVTCLADVELDNDEVYNCFA